MHLDFGKMVSKIVNLSALMVFLGTIAIAVLLLAVNQGTGVNPSPITDINNSSSQTGITYTQEVPFAQ